MSSEIEIVGIKIPQSDWDATPESVKAVVVVLSERLDYIEEQLKQNSQNSSRPPSKDDFSKPEKSRVKKKKKPSQRDVSRKTRELYPIEACKEVYHYVPEKCRHCGEELSGEDREPYRHQIVEIPTLSPYLIEHQQHQLECACCGEKTRGVLPSEVPLTGYGDRLTGVVGG